MEFVNSTFNTTSNLTDIPTPGKSMVPLLFTRTSVLIKFTIAVIMVIIGVPGNAFMSFIIWKTPRLRSRTNVLIGWLTLADLISCISVTLFVAVYQILAFVIYNNPCRYVMVIGLSFTWMKFAPYSGAGILVSIAADRYVAIAHPLHYEQWITERWTTVSVILSWSFGTTICFIDAVYLYKVDFSSCANPYSLVMQAVLDGGLFAVTSTTLMVVYGKLFKIARDQKLKIDATHTSSSDHQTMENIGKFKTELKATRITALILGSNVALWLPYTLGRILQGTGDIRVYTQYLIDVGFSIGSFNYSMDWFIYGISNREFRLAMKTYMKKFFGTGNSEFKE